MATVELRPGDTLNIVWSSMQDTPLGMKEVESSFAFTYDELLQKLRNKSKAGKSRRSGTGGARFSRIVALTVNALRKGKWSTGADIDKNEVFQKLMDRFATLEAEEYPNITEHAKQSLLELYQAKKSNLSSSQKTSLEAVVGKLQLITE